MSFAALKCLIMLKKQGEVALSLKKLSTCRRLKHAVYFADTQKKQFVYGSIASLHWPVLVQTELRKTAAALAGEPHLTVAGGRAAAGGRGIASLQ